MKGTVVSRPQIGGNVEKDRHLISYDWISGFGETMPCIVDFTNISQFSYPCLGEIHDLRVSWFCILLPVT